MKTMFSKFLIISMLFSFPALMAMAPAKQDPAKTEVKADAQKDEKSFLEKLAPDTTKWVKENPILASVAGVAGLFGATLFWPLIKPVAKMVASASWTCLPILATIGGALVIKKELQNPDHENIKKLFEMPINWLSNTWKELTEDSSTNKEEKAAEKAELVK